MKTTRAVVASWFIAATILASLSLALPARSEDWSNDRQWPVMPPPESNEGGIERNGTLRFVRFRTDGEGPLQDQGTVLGWGVAAANGNVEQKHEELPDVELVEIIQRKQPAPAAE